MIFWKEYRLLILFYMNYDKIHYFSFPWSRSRSRNFSIPAPAPAKSFGSDRLRLRNPGLAHHLSIKIGVDLVLICRKMWLHIVKPLAFRINHV